MFNVGGAEMVVVFLVALLVLGPEQLPKAMRTFGNVMGEIRKVSGGFQAEMRKAMDAVDPTGTVSGNFKPQSGKGPAAHQPEVAPSSDGNRDGSEVVARNDGPVATDPVTDRPPVDPADRAAG